MDIERLLIFRDIVECGGFAKAARRRGVSHSTVSRQLKELELSLGVPLMTRTTRTRGLTAAGEIVLRHGRSIGRCYAEMLNELERAEQMGGGELRVGAQVHVGASLVMPAVERFSRRHADVELQLSFDDGPLEFHRRGLDIAVVVGLPRSEQLVVRKLCDNAVCLVASPELAGSHPTPTHPDELGDWPLVAYRSTEQEVVDWPYEIDGQIRILQVRPTLTVGDGVSLLDAVRRGQGVGYLSRFSAAADLAAGTLVELLPRVRLPDYDPVYVVKSDLELVSARVEAFEASLHEVVAAID